jgi:hypothetical protein
MVQRYLQSVLRRHGFAVLMADPHTAAATVASGKLQVDMVITNAPEPFLPVASAIPVLYIAGCPNPELVAPFRHARILRKPFHTDDLISAVEQLHLAV